MTKKLPEQVIYRKVQPAKVTCPNKPNPARYMSNKLISIHECTKCDLHRGYDGEVAACAWKKDGEKDEP